MSEIKKIHNCTVRLTQNDITDFDVEAFVFYARPNLALGSGFGNAIAKRGGSTIKAELDKIGEVPPTEAVVTSGGKLKAKYIVHAVGPAFQEEGLEGKLKRTICNALKRAEEKGIRQIAFPPMGAGFYGVPLPACSDIMLETFRDYLKSDSGLQEVIICANDAREYRAFEARLAALA
ncbi:MAG: macro domain-containing protein [Acidobacteriota bacterium]